MNNIKYNAESIQTLKGLEPFRKSPGMYIGSTGAYGLFHIAKEIINNSIDEYLNSTVGDNIEITILKDGGIKIVDNGRGFPHGMQDKTFSVLGACFGKEHTGGKFLNGTGTSGYNSSGGMHGIGAKCAAALGVKTIATSCRDGLKDIVEFSQGKMLNQQVNLPCDKNLHGTEVVWYPDPEIFTETIEFDRNKIEKELCQEYSFLNQGLHLTIIDEHDNYKKEYYSDNGIQDFLDYLNGDDTYILKPIILNEADGDYSVEIGIAYNMSYGNTIRLYTNSIPQSKGTHLTGFKTAWTAAINNFAKERGWLKENDKNLTGADLEEGQLLIINFKMIDPIFEGQIKDTLTSAEGRTYVQRLVSTSIQSHFSNEIKNVIDKALVARKAADAARKAREAARNQKIQKKKKIINPDKLKDAENLGQDSVLLGVEGLSAAASMAVARDTSKYGILALRGKPLNLLTNSKDKADKNEEIQLLINALGIDPNNYSAKDLRYGRVAIASDADSDGYHIGLLIAAALHIICPEFIKEGRLCWLRSPLYIVKNGKNESYYYDDEEYNAAYSRGEVNGEVQRAKGLGALSAEQAHNSMFTDKFQRLDVLEYSPEAIESLINLMGSSVTKRKDFIFNNIDFSEIKE